MFHISRAMYRELADELTSERDREAVLRACERTVHRLVTDRFYFAHPARTLFNEVRWRFPLHAQTHARDVIERHLSALRAELEPDLEATYALTGARLRCRATTRRSVAVHARPGSAHGLLLAGTGTSPTASRSPPSGIIRRHERRPHGDPGGLPRARALGIPFAGEPGPANAITDVPGLELGYATLIEGESVRTGVTALHPRGRAGAGDPWVAGVHVAERQRRDDRARLDRRGRQRDGPDLPDEHARGRDRARGDRPLDRARASRARRRRGSCRSRARPGTATSTTSTAGT